MLLGQTNYSFTKKDSILTQGINNDSKSKIENWYLKDIYEDSVLGSSFLKALNFIENIDFKDTVKVAVLDMPVDSENLMDHSSLWINNNEIPNNRIDDDLNGYVDDISGWNYLGEISGNQQIFGKYDYTRILENHILFDSRKYTIQQLDSLITYSSNDEVVNASKQYKRQLDYAEKELAYAKMIESILYESRLNLKNHLAYDYSLEDLDRLKPRFLNDTLMSNSILRLHNFKKYGFTESYIRDYYFESKGRLDYLLNPMYEDRMLLGDDRLSSTEDTTTTVQGNGVLSNALHYLNHGVLMTNFISDQNENFNINLKIMPLIVSSLGDEYDKDIFNAIKYAVDNGARVINMSFSKSFSTEPDLIKAAIQYANDNNVLIVTSAGNEGLNIDLNENKIFPNDSGYEVDNFIVVGSTAAHLDFQTVSDFSNYGALNVDLFAPGEDVLILNSDREYEIESGTSVSTALVSKTIGLILSYFPELTAKEAKDVILNSVTKIKGVKSFGKKANVESIDFESASQSGGILNVYKAIKMAKDLSESKR